MYDEGLLVRLRRTSGAARTSREHAAAQREARDRVIEEAEQAGMSLRAIAREASLSPGHVERIVAERTAARQARLAETLAVA